MKTIALAIALTVALTASAVAAAKKPKKAAKPADTMSAAQKTNDASWRLVKDSLPIWLPAWAMPIYVTVNQDQVSPAKPTKAKKTKSAKKT